jgi:hypothetical protein
MYNYIYIYINMFKRNENKTKETSCLKAAKYLNRYLTKENTQMGNEADSTCVGEGRTPWKAYA